MLTQRYGASMAYTTVAGLIAVCGAAYATLPARLSTFAQHSTAVVREGEVSCWAAGHAGAAAANIGRGDASGNLAARCCE